MTLCWFVKKLINKSTRRFSDKHDRATCLIEYLDSPVDRRKRPWKRWFGATLVITALYFIYCYNKDQLTVDTMDENEIISQIENKDEPEKQLKTTTHTVFITRKLEDHTLLTSKATGIDEINYTNTTTVMKPRKNIHCIPLKPRGKINLEIPSFDETLDTLEEMYPYVQKGGYYHPPICSPQQKIAILVPYRDREPSLRVFLYNIHPFLMKQQLEYQIFVIEQYDNKPFNKGRLFNVGFKEMQKYNTFNCVVLHDVDLVPLDDRILYNCPSLPRHMCSHIRKKDLRAANMTRSEFKFGGVTSMTVEQYKRANGFSNMYFGWGGEDNDMMFRLRAAGYPPVRYNKSIAVYAMLPHARAPVNPERYHLLATAMDRYKVDGLSNIKFKVISKTLKHLYTHLVVDIDPSDDHNISNKKGIISPANGTDFTILKPQIKK